MHGCGWDGGTVLPLKKLMYFGGKLFTGPAMVLHSGIFSLEVEVRMVCVPVQGVTTRWHHDSGNKVQMNPKTKGILSVLEGLLQTQNSGWICKPFSEPGSSFPQMQAEVWAEWAQFQVTGWDLWFGVETIWTFDLQPGWSWLWLRLKSLCVFETKSQAEVQGIWASPEPKPEGVCTTLLWTAVRFHVTSLLTRGGSRHEPKSSIQTWSVIAPLPF